MRVSGPATADILGRLVGAPLPPPRRASLRALRDPATGETLDRALVLWMPGPASFTGEDAAELHLHGGVAVRAAVLRALTESGCRLAEPGEFTRRAFINGRLELTEAEGLADLIEAETEGQRRQALRQAEGGLAARAAAWRETLLHALVLCEAELDFADEADVPEGAASPAAGLIDAVRAELREALAGAARGERVRDGFSIVIAGPPNAGKSTLLNAIARRDVAIVSPHPGTTRDVIEVRCDLDGQAVTLIDTAGLRESCDPVEREGVARARARLEAADLILWLSPADAPASPADAPDGVAVVEVATKTDLGTALAGGLGISAATGAGMAELLSRLSAEAARGTDGEAVLTRARHREMVGEMLACLDRAAEAGETELVAEDIRLALRALGRMTGAVEVEEVLGRVFSTFCIGK